MGSPPIHEDRGFRSLMESVIPTRAQSSTEPGESVQLRGSGRLHCRLDLHLDALSNVSRPRWSAPRRRDSDLCDEQRNAVVQSNYSSRPAWQPRRNCTFARRASRAPPARAAIKQLCGKAGRLQGSMLRRAALSTAATITHREETGLLPELMRSFATTTSTRARCHSCSLGDSLVPGRDKYVGCGLR